MALLHIPLAQIDEARLQALIAAGAAESRTIDYKRTIYGNAHADYSEFLADTSSFANTSGGDLVLGMDAMNGIPTAITPLSTPVDPEILRLRAKFARRCHRRCHEGVFSFFIGFLFRPNDLIFLAPRAGFEPATILVASTPGYSQPRTGCS
jgi:hypothetical protein